MPITAVTPQNRRIARGGKAILYQGWADPSVIAGPTIDYYAQLAAAAPFNPRSHLGV